MVAGLESFDHSDRMPQIKKYTSSAFLLFLSLISLSLYSLPLASANDHVSMTKDAALLRKQHLNKKKPLHMRKKHPDEYGGIKGSFTSLLFPGATPTQYEENELIPVFVEYVESRKTQLPVKYFSMPGTCRAPNKAEIENMTGGDNVKIKKKNLGQKLMGSQSTQLTSYAVHALKDNKCTPLCQQSVNSKGIKFLKKLVDKQYRIHFSLDSLPILVRSKTRNYALRGFPIGFKHSPSDNNEGKSPSDLGYYIYNHLRFVIYYNDEASIQSSPNKIQITGFDVVPVSIKQDMQECNSAASTLTNKHENFQPLKTDSAGNDVSILYSYEVSFQKSDITWADRWDIYMMETPDSEIHYFAIVNSLMIAFMLTGVVAVIMVRALKKDIAQYNDVGVAMGGDLQSDGVMIMEESGWKLVHGDVFRPPSRGRTLLSVSVGTGLQIGTAVFLTLVASALRLMNPMKKGQTLSYIIVLYILSGSVAGFFSAKLYKFFNGKAWKRTTLMTAAAFPGALFTLFVALNLFLHLALGKASAAVSFWTILTMFLLWVCVSAPLVFVGAFFGYKSAAIEVPTKTTQIARFVPDSNSWFVKFPHCSLLAGILPFASVAIELSFIMNALWINQIYYIMGFLIIVGFVFTLSCSTTSMVMCYCQLCNEDHRWWWKSFFNGAATSFYLFVYSIWYLVTKLELVGILSITVYISYMALICFAFGLYCGGIGLISSFWFCRKIYAAVKCD